MLPFLLLGAQLSAAILVSRTPEARDCPDTEQFTAKVERVIGRPLATPTAAPDTLVLRAEFSRSGATYEAEVKLSGASEGERVLRDEGPTCEALADAVAVATALLLDRSAAPPLAPASSNPPSNARSSFAWWVSGRFGAGGGLSGGPVWTAGGGVEASLDTITSVELGATVTGVGAHPLGVGSVQVRLWYVEVGAFRSLTGEEVRLGPCAELLAGVLRGASEGYAYSSSASLAWIAVGAGARAEVNLVPGLRLGARVLALVPTRKQSFSIGYVGTAYQSSPVAGMAELLLSAKFP